MQEKCKIPSPSTSPLERRDAYRRYLAPIDPQAQPISDADLKRIQQQFDECKSKQTSETLQWLDRHPEHPVVAKYGARLFRQLHGPVSITGTFALCT